MTRLSIWNDLRPFSVGFDDLFNHFNNTLEYTVKQPTSYPPYNINKVDDLNYQIEKIYYHSICCIRFRNSINHVYCNGGRS